MRVLIGVFGRGSTTREDMDLLFRERIKGLADRNDWSLEHAKGFVDGETSRRRGQGLSKLALVGIDEYSLGFRAGFFERGLPEGRPGGRLSLTAQR